MGIKECESRGEGPTPENAKERAKEIICKIIALNGGHVVRKGHIYKAFHAAHLFYWEQANGALSDYPIVKMPKGPGIDNADLLFTELINEGKIRMSKQMVGPYAADRFEYIGESFSLDAAETKAILDALEFVRDKDTQELAMATHNAAWKAVGLGDEMDVYLDTMTESELEKMKSANDEAKRVLASVFG